MQVLRRAGQALEQLGVYGCGVAARKGARRGRGAGCAAAAAVLGQGLRHGLRCALARALRRCLRRQWQLGQQVRHGALGQGRDGEQGVDAERAWDDRAVEHEEPRPDAAIGTPDAAAMVDHGAVEIVAHGAAAQWVHAEQGARQLGPAHHAARGVGQQLPARRVQVHATGVLRAIEHFRLRLIAGQLGRIARPIGHAGVAIGKPHDAPGRAVVAHHQQHLRVRCHGAGGERICASRGGLARRAPADIAKLLERVGAGKHLLRDARHRTWHGAVLHHQALRQRQQGAASRRACVGRTSLGRGVATQVDELRDRRPDRGLAGQCAAAHGVDHLGLVDDEAQAVAIARQPRAQRTRQGERGTRVLATALQELGAAKGAGGHDDAPRKQDARVAADGRVGRCGMRAQAIAAIGLDAPQVAGGRRYAIDGGAAHDASAALHGLREVGVAQGQLGTFDVAAAGAVAAGRATLRVDGGKQRARARTVAQEGCEPRMGFRLGQHLAWRPTRHAQGLQRAPRGCAQRELGRAVLVPQSGGPAGLLAHIGVGRQRDAGIDQAATAHAIGRERDHARTDVPVEQARGRAGHARTFPGRCAQVLGQLTDVVGKVARQVFAAALEHDDLVPGLRQAKCGHRATVARADDQRVEHAGRVGPVGQRGRQLRRACARGHLSDVMIDARSVVLNRGQPSKACSRSGRSGLASTKTSVGTPAPVRSWPLMMAAGRAPKCSRSAWMACTPVCVSPRW